jgi:Protein of unknown function (DUF2934)
MDRLVRKFLDNLLIIIETSKDPHKQIIQSAIAKRAYQIFEKRGCKHGFDLEDWKTAEKELLRDDFDGNTSEFHFFIECPRDLEVTTILSLAANSLVVFRSHTRLFGKTENRQDVLSVHVLPEEIDPTQVYVKVVDGLLLHVYLPKKNNHKVRVRRTSAASFRVENCELLGNNRFGQ